LPLTGAETGIDRGLESFATLATGEAIANPRIFQVAELSVKRAQRRMKTANSVYGILWRYLVVARV
jgi:transposase